MVRKPAQSASTCPSITGSGFTGFGQRGLQFLTDLAANQTREWFTANRGIYDRDLYAPMAALVDDLAFAMQAHGIALTGNAKQSIFRINRDVRFSKDKSPYKTNVSAALSRDGTKQGLGVLYVQVDGTEGAFMALGFYGPEQDDLSALRQAIVDLPKAWAKVESALKASQLSLSREHALARIPKGFEAHAGTPLADTLRLKSLIVTRPIAPDRLSHPDLVTDIVMFAQAGEALLTFGRNAIDKGRSN